MALFSNLALTAAGNKAINDYVLGTSKTPISITAIAIGDGAAPKDTVNITKLVNELKRLPVETTNIDKGVLTVTAQFSTDSITKDITHREIGLYSGNSLIAYANAGNDYDFIPAAGKNTAVIKKIAVRLTVGTVSVKMETLPVGDYITYAGVEQRILALAPTVVDKIFDEYMATGQWNQDIHDVVIEALNEDAVSTRTTPEPTATHTVSWVHLDARHTAVGRLHYITIDTTTQAHVDGEYALCIMEQDESGGWQFLAASRNATHFQIGQQSASSSLLPGKPTGHPKTFSVAPSARPRSMRETRPSCMRERISTTSSRASHWAIAPPVALPTRTLTMQWLTSARRSIRS